jgi:tripartite ATP-independent transporter DctM subunit
VGLSEVLDFSHRATHGVARWINGVGIAVLAAMMTLTAADVCLRYLFNRPIMGAYELNEFMMAVLVGLSFAYTAIHKEHVGIEFLVARFPPRGRAVTSTIASLLSLGILAVITWQSVLYAIKLKADGYMSESLFIPLYPFVYVLAFGCAIFFLVILSELLSHLKRVTEGSRWNVWLPLLLVIVFVLFLFVIPLFRDFMPWRMSPLEAGLVGISLLVVLLFSGLSIGIGMGLVGFLGMVYLNGMMPGLDIMGRTPYGTVTSYSLSVVPLFILMGAFCFHSGLSTDIYYAVHRWVGHFRGGLAMATVGACALFAAVSGSSLATAATMGRVALPEMKKYKYAVTLASGSIAAGGSIGILIPPSTILVIYAILTEQSIGKLFLAGFIPGILEALFYMVTIYIVCSRNPLIGPRGPSSSFKEKVFALKSAWGVFVLFLLVIGGIYLGVFTPTEAAGIGAFGALLFSFGRRKVTWKNFVASLQETSKTTAMMFLILIGAMVLGYFLAVTRLPFELSTFVAGLAVNRYLILSFIIVLYLLLGAIFSALAIIVLTVPILFPVVTALGFDPIWFGIIIVRMVEIGQITPPMGINVFVLKGVAGDIPVETIFRGIVPFLIADLCHVALLIIFPQIATFLPSLMK